MGDEQKRFPIMHGPPDFIPWAMIAPHAQQARNNHYQTLERLAERGGLSPCEAMAILEDRDWRKDPYASQKLIALALEFEKGLPAPYTPERIDEMVMEFKRWEKFFNDAGQTGWNSEFNRPRLLFGAAATIIEQQRASAKKLVETNEDCLAKIKSLIAEKKTMRQDIDHLFGLLGIAMNPGVCEWNETHVKLLFSIEVRYPDEPSDA